MRAELRISLAAAFALATLSASRANAFCRTTTDATPADYDARNGGCATTGVPVYQPSQCLAYRLTKESRVIPNAVLSDKLARAFAAWTAPNATCTPGISTIELAPWPDPLVVGYTIGQPGQNFVGVRESWPYDEATLSLPSLRYNVGTGDPRRRRRDQRSRGVVVRRHGGARQSRSAECSRRTAGHVLGFAHSDVEGATMISTYANGSIEERTLEADDQAAVCTVYPNRSQRLAATGLVPSTACNLAAGSCSDAQISHGCSTMPSPRSTGAGAGLLVALGITLAARRGRRRNDGSAR